MGPKTAVILSTYNRPEFLELSLTGLLVQTDTEFDIVIADDGSGPETKQLIERFQKESPIPIHHVWQEDKGFRKAKILNEAVHSTDADLLVFLDQDAIPGRDWMALHREIYAPNRFVPGGYIRLTKEDSAQLNVEKVTQGAHEALMTKERMKFLKRRHLKSLWYFLTGNKIRPRLMGLNFSAARDLYEKVNGYDEAYEGWGKEDSDLRTRMRQSGASARCLWNKSIVYHLWHPVESTKADFSENQKRYNLVKRRKLPWRCENGYALHLEETTETIGR